MAFRLITITLFMDGSKKISYECTKSRVLTKLLYCSDIEKVEGERKTSY